MSEALVVLVLVTSIGMVAFLVRPWRLITTEEKSHE